MPLLGERGQHLQGLHVEIAALRPEQEQEQEEEITGILQG